MCSFGWLNHPLSAPFKVYLYVLAVYLATHGFYPTQLKTETGWSATHEILLLLHTHATISIIITGIKMNSTQSPPSREVLLKSFLNNRLLSQLSPAPVIGALQVFFFTHGSSLRGTWIRIPLYLYLHICPIKFLSTENALHTSTLYVFLCVFWTWTQTSTVFAFWGGKKEPMHFWGAFTIFVRIVGVCVWKGLHPLIKDNPRN